MDHMDQELRLAVLIDADNAPRTALREIMAEVAVYGTPTIKRIYGDWTSPNMSTWKSILLETAITPIQQYSYTTGKNATDSAMIIDAMDILYSGNVDGYCIVSSDSDFTRLAARLRESGMLVLGMGEEKTPKPQSFTMSLMSLSSKPKRRSGLSEPKRSMASRQGMRRKGVFTSTSSTSLNTRFRKPS